MGSKGREIFELPLHEQQDQYCMHAQAQNQAQVDSAQGELKVAQPQLRLLTHGSSCIPAFFMSKNGCRVSMKYIFRHTYIANI
jgi:hypothetical protein